MTWNSIIRARRVIQNNQEFLLGTFPIRHVREFTRFTEHLIVGYAEVEDDEKVFVDSRQIRPLYNPEIQRRVSPSKVEGIANFLIYDPSAMFPTNIVVAIPSQVIDSMEDSGDEVKITLNKIVNYEINKDGGDVYLTIIDGQHRIRGIERAIELVQAEINILSATIRSSVKPTPEIESKLSDQKGLLERLLKFELLVTFFVDPTLEYQAMVFATINKTQTKVPQNLVYSLFGLTKDDSPQKSSLEVVMALNGIEKSPFFNRVRLVGGRYQNGQMVPLSQATMVRSVLRNITRKEEIERFKKRNELMPTGEYLPFRKYYHKDEDFKIVRIMFSFYSAVREVFIDSDGKSLWTISDMKRITNVLQTNVGFQALLKILLDALSVMQESDKDNKEWYIRLLRPAAGLDFEDRGPQKRYPYTSASIKVLYEDIKSRINGFERTTLKLP